MDLQGAVREKECVLEVERDPHYEASPRWRQMGEMMVPAEKKNRWRVNCMHALQKPGKKGVQSDPRRDGLQRKGEKRKKEKEENLK